jgi:hypothetical protein
VATPLSVKIDQAPSVSRDAGDPRVGRIMDYARDALLPEDPPAAHVPSVNSDLMLIG